MSEENSPRLPATAGQSRLSRRKFIVSGAAAVTAVAGGSIYYDQRVEAIGTFDPNAVRQQYQGRTNALFVRFPGLHGKLPWAPLGSYPTPVERFAGPIPGTPSG